MSNALFDTHPKLTLGFFVLFLLLLLAGLSEIFLRFIVSYDIGYYTAVKKQGKYEYPYGTIYMNEAGYPDTAFDLGSSKNASVILAIPLSSASGQGPDTVLAICWRTDIRRLNTGLSA